MVSEYMHELGSKKSTIRDIFEYGRKRVAEVGRENVFDFSIGNPNVPCPAKVNETIKKIVSGNVGENIIHGYTPAAGLPRLRVKISEYIEAKFGFKIGAENIFVTSGAAHGLVATIKALAEKGDEFIAFAPFFPEYRCFVEAAGAKFNVVPAKIEDFQIDFDKLEESVTPNLKGVIINSPNNPTGTVYSEDTLKKLTEFLCDKQKKYGHPIYIIADEPYRDIAFDDVDIKYIPKIYDNTIVVYSYSKSLSVPGERIGYIAVSERADKHREIFDAIAGATRISGHVNPPSLFQYVILECMDEKSDISIYKKNRDLLYNALSESGFTCVKPQGAFYLFPQSPESDSRKFCNRAKELDILLVPGDDFGCEGHFRLSYCMETSMIERAIPVFEKLAKQYE